MIITLISTLILLIIIILATAFFIRKWILKEDCTTPENWDDDVWINPHKHLLNIKQKTYLWIPFPKIDILTDTQRDHIFNRHFNTQNPEAGTIFNIDFPSNETFLLAVNEIIDIWNNSEFYPNIVSQIGYKINNSRSDRNSIKIDGSFSSILGNVQIAFWFDEYLDNSKQIELNTVYPIYNTNRYVYRGYHHSKLY